MKTNYNYIIDQVLVSEGGYVDHPSDPGGATNMGITHRTLAAWRNISPYTKLPKSEIKNLGNVEAKAIYRQNYWNAVRGDDLPSGLDYAVFDFGVNSGPSRAIIALQRLLGVADDGVMGPLTIKAANDNKDLKTLINRYQDDRLRFLKSLSTFGVFGKGWSSRVERVRKASLELATYEDATKPEKSGNGLAALIPILITLATAFFGWLQSRSK